MKKTQVFKNLSFFKFCLPMNYPACPELRKILAYGGRSNASATSNMKLNVTIVNGDSYELFSQRARS